MNPRRHATIAMVIVYGGVGLVCVVVGFHLGTLDNDVPMVIVYVGNGFVCVPFGYDCVDEMLRCSMRLDCDSSAHNSSLVDSLICFPSLSNQLLTTVRVCSTFGILICKERKTERKKVFPWCWWWLSGIYGGVG